MRGVGVRCVEALELLDHGCVEGGVFLVGEIAGQDPLVVEAVEGLEGLVFFPGDLGPEAVEVVVAAVATVGRAPFECCGAVVAVPGGGRVGRLHFCFVCGQRWRGEVGERRWFWKGGPVFFFFFFWMTPYLSMRDPWAESKC